MSDPFLSNLISGNWAVDPEKGFRIGADLDANSSAHSSVPSSAASSNVSEAPSSAAPTIDLSKDTPPPSPKHMVHQKKSLPAVNSPPPLLGPRKMKYPVFFEVNGRGSVASRRSWSMLICNGNAIALKDGLIALLRHVDDSKDIENFKIGWGADLDSKSRTFKAPPNLIISYDPDMIDWRQCTHLTCIERESAATTTAQSRRQKLSKKQQIRYSNKEDAMKFGEQRLKSIYENDWQTFNKIKKNKRVFAAAKYRLGLGEDGVSGPCTLHEFNEWIDQELQLMDDKDAQSEHEQKQPTNPSASNAKSSESQMEKLINLMLVKELSKQQNNNNNNNQQQMPNYAPQNAYYLAQNSMPYSSVYRHPLIPPPIIAQRPMSYSSLHSSNSNVANYRFDPLSLPKIDLNDAQKKENGKSDSQKK